MKTIGDISSLLGISNTLLRTYEERGLVKPFRNADTGYRYFDIDQTMSLCYSLRLRAYGFTTNDLCARRHARDIEATQRMYQERIESLEDDIERKRRVLACLKREEQVLRDSTRREGIVWRAMRPAMYVLLFYVQDDFRFDSDSEFGALVSTWLRATPFRLMVTVLPAAELDCDCEVWSGAALLEEDARYLQVDTHDMRVRYLPEVECLCTQARGRRGNDAFRSSVAPLVHEAKRSGLSLSGDILSWDYSGLDEDEAVCRKLWAPICATP